MVISSASTELSNGTEPSRVLVVCQPWIKYKFLVDETEMKAGEKRGKHTHTKCCHPFKFYVRLRQLALPECLVGVRSVPA